MSKHKILSPVDRAIDELMAVKWGLVRLLDQVNKQIAQLERSKKK